ncbi:endonuclease/exonuclease/phosphatase family protein [Dyadobacter sp. CY261]|uniref:endonuclease/exonuclease/phosphatase family protein n=1 Tax=Dyadobacter sp. CY261 TaxID=2907203 RepID=UPI001F34C372|nr:endonuclease/exonuclease/phosphatase family protein [Dyadobacter sp. CY261]MCF0074404.1 endonuclease/exonuclease/phosphatase family protein [Dyadobacter sp. CY261]
MWSTLLHDKNRVLKSASWLFILFSLSEATPPVRHTRQQAAPAAFQFPSESTSGSFSVITYNIAGLPQIISSAVSPRKESIAAIGHLLNRYDIAHVQEDFNYNQHLYGSGNAHPFRTPTKGAVMNGDGLNTLSKFPVTNLHRVAWTDCTGADCLTPKGFTYTRIEIARNRFIDFYNVHANAYNHPRAALARRHNMEQLSAYIRLHSVGKAVVVMGDLNGRYSFGRDNVHWLLKENGLSDAWVNMHCSNQLPSPSDAIPASDILGLTDSCETIDKILFRSSPFIQLKPAAYALEKELFTNAKGIPLSDHHPVSARFEWNVLEDVIAYE